MDSGTVSHRDKGSGTRFGLNLARKLIENASHLDLMQILEQVSEKMRQFSELKIYAHKHMTDE